MAYVATNVDWLFLIKNVCLFYDFWSFIRGIHVSFSITDVSSSILSFNNFDLWQQMLPLGRYRSPFHGDIFVSKTVWVKFGFTALFDSLEKVNCVAFVEKVLSHLKYIDSKFITIYLCQCNRCPSIQSQYEDFLGTLKTPDFRPQSEMFGRFWNCL